MIQIVNSPIRPFDDWRQFNFQSIKTKALNASFLPFKIVSIEEKSFIDFFNLEELISFSLATLESNSFQHLNKLKKLDLSENQIEQIYSNGFQGLDNGAGCSGTCSSKKAWAISGKSESSAVRDQLDPKRPGSARDQHY